MSTRPPSLRSEADEPKLESRRIRRARRPVSRSSSCSDAGSAPRAAAALAPAGSKAKAAFTLRLDPARHLKLRLACAVDGRSAQQIVTDALDRLLDDMPELDAMAEKAKRKG